ncbi:MAG: hypothetical protein JNM51_12265 [Bacteroidia bacterium]|nr:hypothetical protein [Bacteroidia bacterium]
MKKRLHILFSFFLLISFSWQCAARSVIYLSFKYNQKELAETVCENKNKPMSCCAAKCYLDKEIKKEDKRQSDSSTSIKDKAEKSELRTGLITFLFSPSVLLHYYQVIPAKSLPDNFLSSVFHPPGK